jgi:hypothetical protein
LLFSIKLLTTKLSFTTYLEYKLGSWLRNQKMSIKNGFIIETMYVYYIVMEIYVFVCIHIFSPFYFLCITNMPHHSPTMDFTHRFIHSWGNRKGKKTVKCFWTIFYK